MVSRSSRCAPSARALTAASVARGGSDGCVPMATLSLRFEDKVTASRLVLPPRAYNKRCPAFSLEALSHAPPVVRRGSGPPNPPGRWSATSDARPARQDEPADEELQPTRVGALRLRRPLATLGREGEAGRRRV